MFNKKFFGLCFVLIFSVISVFAQDTIWVRRLDLGSDEVANGIAASNHKIGIAGYRLGMTSDFLVVKYNEQGDTLWTRTYDTGTEDYAVDVSFDPQENLLITGYSYSYAASKEKFPLRLASYLRRTEDFQEFIATTQKYDSAGTILWQRTELDKVGIGVTADNNGNGYISGFVFTGFGYDFWLVKYDPNGETLWSRTLDFFLIDAGYRNAIDNEGNIVITGLASNDGYTFDGFVFKFTEAGDTLWTRFFDLNLIDYGIGVAIDQENNIIVAGITGDTLNYDYLILKYSPNGNLIWTRTYSFAKDEGALGVACDNNNNIFVAGYSGESFLSNYLTIKFDPAGNVLWTAIYDNGSDDEGADVVCDEVGNPIVTGGSWRTSYDLLTLKYRGETGISEPSIDHSKKKPVSATTFGNSLVLNPSKQGYYELLLFDGSGRLKQEIFQGFLEKGTHRFQLTDLSCGVYFIKMKTSDHKSGIHKLIMVK